MDKKKSSKNRCPKGEAGIWKEKYDTLDEKYTRMKDIFKQVLHGVKDEAEKLRLVQKENSELKEELNEKEHVLERLQSVSEAVVDEYSILKTKYEMESEAATEASKRATKYLQQNIILKRKSTVPPHIPLDLSQVDLSESFTDGDGLEESQDAEIELLRASISDLRGEVATLKIQLEKEIEKQGTLKEDTEIAKKLFEEEMIAHNETKAKLKLVEKSLEQLKRVSELYVKEFEGLQSRYEEESDKVKRINCEITTVQKENIVLSEQQSILLNKSNPSDQLSAALERIEKLTIELNDEKACQQLEVEELQNKLKRYEDEASIRATEEKLHCMEQCLEHAEQRAYASERQTETLKHRIQELECQVQRLNAGLPLPPPPPPPPPPPSFNPIKSLMTLISSAKKASTISTLKKEAGDSQQQKAMSEMINAIKKGNVHLRPAPKGSGANYEMTQEKSAVGEMKDILSSLKKQKEENLEELSPRSLSPESSSNNELLEKLEKWRKISSLSDKSNHSKDSVPEGDEKMEVDELQKGLKIESSKEVYQKTNTSFIEDFLDNISRPCSHAEGGATEPVSKSEEADCVVLRKHSQSNEYAELLSETVNSVRSTYVVDSAMANIPLSTVGEMLTSAEAAVSENEVVNSNSPSLDSDVQESNENVICELQKSDNKDESLHVELSFIMPCSPNMPADCDLMDSNCANVCPKTQYTQEAMSNEQYICPEISEQAIPSEELPEIPKDEQLNLHDAPVLHITTSAQRSGSEDLEKNASLISDPVLDVTQDR